jgi:DNA-binding transcriptional LysR family regulator
MDVDLELVASFLGLVDEWHYRRAADALFLSASALTKRIQRLERQLGVRLVERGPEGMAGLTAAGTQFAAAARPLLEQARAAAQAARAASARDVLRVGVPAGVQGSFVPSMGLDDVGDRVCRAFPGLHVALVEVPFPLVTRCLPDGQADVLLTIAAVRHREVDSIPLPVTSARIGVVSARHPLAGAAEVDVARFCEHSLLHNPAVPDEWMRPFWLADVRPRAEARLTITHGSNNQRVLRDVQSGSAALVTLSPDHHALPPGLQGVTLAGAEPLTFYAARRRRDRRTVVDSYVELLRTLGPRSLQ